MIFLNFFNILAKSSTYGEWLPYGECSSTCSQGLKTRRKDCEDLDNQNCVRKLGTDNKFLPGTCSITKLNTKIVESVTCNAGKTCPSK